jgi:hypothetical protein
MNHLNYNKYIKQINKENTIEFECEESDLSDYSDYSDYSDTTDTVVYEDYNVSLLATNHVDHTQAVFSEPTFVDINLDVNLYTNTLTEQDNVQDNIEEDTPIPFKEKIRHIHNRQKNIICSALKCTIL